MGDATINSPPSTGGLKSKSFPSITKHKGQILPFHYQAQRSNPSLPLPSTVGGLYDMFHLRGLNKHLSNPLHLKQIFFLFKKIGKNLPETKMELEKKDWENFLKQTEEIIKNLKLNLKVNEECKAMAERELKKLDEK